MISSKADSGPPAVSWLLIARVRFGRAAIQRPNMPAPWVDCPDRPEMQTSGMPCTNVGSYWISLKRFTSRAPGVNPLSVFPETFVKPGGMT